MLQVSGEGRPVRSGTSNTAQRFLRNISFTTCSTCHRFENFLWLMCQACGSIARVVSLRESHVYWQSFAGIFAPGARIQPALKMQSSRNRNVPVFAAVTKDAADEVFRIISRAGRLAIRSLQIGATADWAYVRLLWD